MKIKLLILPILFFASLNSKNDESENYAVLSHKEKIELEQFMKGKSLKSAVQIYKFCFDERKYRNYIDISQIKAKFREYINKNIKLLKSQIPENILKYCYQTNPNTPEAQYLKRGIEMNAVHLLGGTLCRCCVPVEIQKNESYYILTGKELHENDEFRKKEYDEFQQWALSETKKYEDTLNRLSNSGK